jgi:hypothetical protein
MPREINGVREAPGNIEDIKAAGMYEPIRAGDDAPPKPTVLDQTRGAASRILGDLRRAIPPSLGTSRTVAHDGYDSAANAIANAGAAIVKANSDARSVANNRDLYPSGRQDRINGIVADTDGKVSKAIDTIEAAVELMQASLESQALPASPNRTDAVALRSEALSLLDRVSGEKQQELFTRLATRGDEVSALLLSSYGLDLAEVLFGQRLGEALWKGAHGQALQNAYTNGNAQAIAATQVGKLKGVAAGLLASWDNASAELRNLKFS